MREKKSAASSRAESFLSARADFTASIVQFVDICVVAYTVGHDISCPYAFASVHSARNGPLQKAGPTTKNKIAQQAGCATTNSRTAAGRMPALQNVRPQRSTTFGTRKKGGSGSGACFRTSAATVLRTWISSRRVASAV